MKTIKILLAVAMILPGYLISAQSTDVNLEKSQIKWEGKKIGGKHFGDIQLKSASLEVADNTIENGHFKVDMHSITVEDLENEEYNAKLVGHLKSDDFFGVEEFPNSMFVISKPAKFVNGKATVTGDLTIKGKTESISFDVVKKNKEYHATIEVDRSKYDVRYGSKSFFKNIGDKAIDDIFTLEVKLII